MTRREWDGEKHTGDPLPTREDERRGDRLTGALVLIVTGLLLIAASWPWLYYGL